MRQLTLMALTALVLCALAASAAAVASAEDGLPAILTLTEKIEKLEGTLKGAITKIETTANKVVKAGSASLAISKCAILGKRELDTNLCTGLLTLSETKFEGAGCRS
ncbi:MAG TPA: hypothetical protein VGH21_04285, partial [Solirubrobacteraceae bacterium]